jgi:dihydroorotate dehydrogenase
MYTHCEQQQCLYDLNESFATNCTRQFPSLTPTYNRKKSPTSNHTLLGYPVNSLIGIPACAIMTGNGIEWASKAGYDILTYKTVRSTPATGHPLPNIFLLENNSVSCSYSGNYATTTSTNEPTRTDVITMANSMGCPSLSLDWVLADITKARNALNSGQILIVSIIGSQSETRTLEEDFAFLAQKIVDAGAHVIEANLSCPNLHSSLETYKDPVAVTNIVRAIHQAAPNIPVIIKVGLFDTQQQMKEIFCAAAQAGARGVCGINALPTKIVNQEGEPAFGTQRPIAGASGERIRPHSLSFIAQARQIIDEENLDFVLLATGGVMKPEHFKLFLAAGADSALSATGTMWNPHLAIEFHKQALIE